MSYAQQHNEANGEDNNDGQGENYSANWGVEGETTDTAILKTRGRVQRAMLASVLLAHGTPMLLAGDEFGRTQRGNNNAYCQDDEISWLDWRMLETPAGRELHDFTSRLIALRQEHAALRSRHFLHGRSEVAPNIFDIAWFEANGELVLESSWKTPETQPALSAAGDAERRWIGVAAGAAAQPDAGGLPLYAAAASAARQHTDRYRAACHPETNPSSTIR